VEGSHVESTKDKEVVLTDGTTLAYDVLFLATGVEPPPLFVDSGLPSGDDGGLLVNEYLQSPAYPEIFGGGDCIWFSPSPLDKVGVYAVRENPLIAHNIAAVLTGEPLRKLDHTGGYLLIYNLGDGRGIYWKNPIVFGGRTAFRIKDYIDRTFMAKFQLSGEREEEDDIV